MVPPALDLQGKIVDHYSFLVLALFSLTKSYIVRKNGCTDVDVILLLLAHTGAYDPV